MFASKNGHIEVVSKILCVSTDGIDMQDTQGRTALQLAADEGWEDVVALLIQKGANVDIKSNFGTSPLEYAAGKGHKKIISMLLSAAADLNDSESVISRVAEMNQYIFSKHFDLEAFGDAETMFYFRTEQKTLLQSVMRKGNTKKGKEKHGEKENQVQKEGNEENIEDDVFAETMEESKDVEEQKEQKFQKSLIHSVVEQGLVREREQVLDSLVKVQEEKQKQVNAGLYSPEEGQYRVAENIKSGIPSSVGLAEALESLSDRFPWTRTKMIVMFIVSFVTNIVFGTGFYVADIVTDILFSRDIFTQQSKDFTQGLLYCTPRFNEHFNNTISTCYGIKFDDRDNQDKCLEALRSITTNGSSCFHNEERFTYFYAHEL